jgi:hypothetical protein
MMCNLTIIQPDFGEGIYPHLMKSTTRPFTFQNAIAHFPKRHGGAINSTLAAITV